jgi:hypothetical protein
MTNKKRPRGLSDRLLTSGLLQVFGLDLLLLVAVACDRRVGLPALAGPGLGLRGCLILLAWWSIGRGAPGPKGELMFSERLLERRGEEVPNTGTFLSPSVSLLSALGGGRRPSGVRINEYTAEGIPAWFAVRGVVSETVGQVPLKIFRSCRAGSSRTRRTRCTTSCTTSSTPR